MSSSGDAGRPSRLRWTRELHTRFVRAVSELGGADKATPKSVLRAMAPVQGLTLHRIKAYLQKYRMAVVEATAENGAGQNEWSSSSSSENEYDEDTVTEMYPAFADDEGEPLCDSPRSVAWMQREVQRSLHEQIEVQRHLQLRIEAQGRYLQSVLHRAYDLLADQSLGFPAGPEAELSDLTFAAAASTSSSSLSLSPPRHLSTDSCVTSSSEAESKAGAKRLCTCVNTRECTVEQTVQSKRAVLQSHLQQQQGDAEEPDAENGSSEIDLNR